MKPTLDAAFKDINYVPAAVKPTLGLETYPEFIEAGVPSIFYWIGGSGPEQIEQAKLENRPVAANHSPLFAPDAEITIWTGAKQLTISVLEKAQVR